MLEYIKRSNYKIFILFTLLITTVNAQYLHVVGKEVFGNDGKKIILKGMGLGGWLVPEGYMLGTWGSPTSIRNRIVDLIGEDSTKVFYEKFEKNYVAENDISQLAEWGFNSVRLPFHYKTLSPSYRSYNEEGFAVIDSVIDWCARNEIYLILDMHVAPGSQSGDENADGDEGAKLWDSKENQDWAVDIWGEIAKRYATERWIGGYDLLNEPVLFNGGRQVRDLQRQMRNRIRKYDLNHTLFVNGNMWSRAFEGLGPALDENMIWAFHYYSWMVFNRVNQNTIQYLINFRNLTNRPLWLGEAGENSNEWFMEVTNLMEKNDIGWAWWNYKKIGTITGPVSSPSDSVYQEITRYWNGDGGRPSNETAQLGLNNMVENLKLENCEIKKGVIASLLDDNYGTKNLPFKDLFIPGKIDIVDYDLGANGLAYFDFDYIDNRPNGGGLKTWNNGWAYRNDGVDIQVSSDTKISKYHVSHTESGEFLKYTINVLKDDVYDFSIISSAESAEASVALYNSQNQVIISEKKLPVTQDYDLWVETVLGEAELKKGVNEIRLSIIRGGANLKILKVSSNSSRSGEVIFSHKIYPNPTSNSSSISFESLSEKHVKINVYNVQGQLVWSDNTKAFVGDNIYKLILKNRNGKGLSNGIYFLTLDDGKKTIKEKITLIK
tara:strand:- start:2427 stop:4415 length:1989 start_codon:yes stop_codon:yes gene_type:complete